MLKYTLFRVKEHKPKIVVRENPEDSEGSELSCSPISSPERLVLGGLIIEVDYDYKTLKIK